MALVPSEQNFGESMEFRHELSQPSRKRKPDEEIKCGGRMMLDMESLSNVKLGDQVAGMSDLEGESREDGAL